MAWPRAKLLLVVGAFSLATLAVLLFSFRRPADPPPEDCEDFSFVPCPRQTATISIPVAGSSFTLEYSSDRVPGRTVEPSLDARPLGLERRTV